jgi:hypothetical protein
MQMMLMIPAMLGAMLYRKEEYSALHRAHRHYRRWFAGAAVKTRDWAMRHAT